jgi:hypothetical protein
MAWTFETWYSLSQTPIEIDTYLEDGVSPYNALQRAPLAAEPGEEEGG